MAILLFIFPSQIASAFCTVDDSAAYSLLADMDSRQIQYDPLDEAIKAGLLKNAKYDRVIDLNFITVTVGYPESV